MKKKIITLVITGVVLFAAYLVNVQVQTHLGEKTVASTGLTSLTLKEALAQSKKLDKPVLVEMSAIWCPTCRKLDKKVLSNSEIAKLITDKFVFSRLEYESEEGKTFREDHQVSGFPVLMVFNSKMGSPIRLPLTFSPEEFKSKLNRLLAGNG